MAVASFEDIWQEKKVPSFEDLWKSKSADLPPSRFTIPGTVEYPIPKEPQRLVSAKEPFSQKIVDFLGPFPLPEAPGIRYKASQVRDYFKYGLYKKDFPAAKEAVKKGVPAGFVSLGKMPSQFGQMLAEVEPKTRMTPKLVTPEQQKEAAAQAKKVSNRIDAFINENWPLDETLNYNETPLARLTQSTTRGALPSMTIAIGASILTGNPWPGLLFLGATETGGAYERQRGYGETPNRAAMKALASGGIEVATERIPFDFLLHGRIVVGPAMEALQEKLAGLGQNYIDEYTRLTVQEGIEPIEASKRAVAFARKQSDEDALVGATVGLLGAGSVSISRAARPAISELGLDKKSQQFKEFALTKEGSEKLAAMSPDVAAKIAAKEQPSRNDLKELGITGWNAEERKQLSSLFRDALKPVAAEVTPEKRQQAIDYVKSILSQEQYADLDEKAIIEIGQKMLAEQGVEVTAEELAEAHPTVPIPAPEKPAKPITAPKAPIIPAKPEPAAKPKIKGLKAKPVAKAEPAKVEKEIEYEEEAITEPPESPKVDTGEARKLVPTGKLDPTDAKEALEITKKHAQWVAEGKKYDPRNAWEGIKETKTEWDEKEKVEKIITTSVEYTPEQIDTAYRTIQKPVESPMSDTDLFAMPGKEAQMKAIAQKMAKVKGVVKPKKKGPKALTKPTALPKAKTKKEDFIKSVFVAASQESTRYAMNGVLVEGDFIVATDGRRLFWAKGKWGKDGLYLDAASLKKGSLGKPHKQTEKDKRNFPAWRDIVPEVSKRDAIMVDLETTLRHVRQAASVTTEESKGITIIENKDEALGLGFAAASPEVGHAEINVYPGGRILGAVNPRFLMDAIKFHAIRGDTVIEFFFSDPTRPMLTKSPDGKTNTVTSPINVGEPSEALVEAITGFKPKSKGLKEKPAEETKRVISKEAYEKAKKRLTDRGTLRMGVDPQGFADLLTIGLYHFESGVRKFAEWSKKMIEEFGENVKPHLKAVFDQIPNARERGFITSVKEKFPEMASRVAGQYIPRSTDKLSIAARNLIKDDIDAAEELARTGTNDKAVATASELINHYNKLAEATTDRAAQLTFYEKAANIAHPAAANLTELGRAIQAASTLGKLTPESQLRVAAREINKHNAKQKRGRKKIPKLTTEQTEEILKKTKAIGEMPDGEGKAKAFWELQKNISELVPTPLWKKLINVWKAGLLTGLKTSGLNTFSNLAHGISEIAKEVPATGFDIMFSLVTKKRTIGLTVRGVPSGLKKGAARGWRYLKTGFDERNVAAKLDYHRVNMGKGKFARAVGAYTDAIFRMMGAEDQPFYYGALARSLYSQAIADAKNKGLKGKEAKTYIENQVENPTDTMLNYAVNDALIAVYQNKTLLGKIGKKFQEMPVIGEVIAPFVRTPSAVAMQIINYSPVGVVKTAIENIGKGKFDQRLLSQGLARGLLGTGVLYLGTKLFMMGLISLGYPKGERERKLWEIEGRKPNSIKVGGKWRDVQVLGPVGPLLLIGGYFQQSLDSTGSPTEAMSTAMFGGAKSFSEQTFVKGVSAFAKAVSDPERSWENFYSSLAGSTIPTIISDIARATDTGARRTKGPVQRIRVRIPGLRHQLEPRIDVFGNDLPRYGGNVYEVMLDPTRPFKINEDVVVDELRRLWDNGHKVSPTQLGYKYGYEFLTVEENTQMFYAVGSLTYERLHYLLQRPGYKSASDEVKAKAIERKVDKVKEHIKIRFRIKQRKEAFEKEVKRKRKNKIPVTITLQKR